MFQLLPFWHRCLHSVLPNCCLWCQLPVQQAHQQICDYCNAALPKLSLTAQQDNALLLPAVWRGLAPVRFDRLVALSWYQLPWSYWISQWKFQQDMACGALLCQQLQQAALAYQQQGGTLPDAICYVPISARRRSERGFNQAEMLAAELARSWNIPLLHLFVRRAGDSHQVGLNRQQRRGNLRREFRLRQAQQCPPHLLLVDDVITTGATVDQLCRLLKKQHVRQIDVWTLAITAAQRKRRTKMSPGAVS